MLPLFANSDKKDIHFKELLTHSAGLVAWIPFYKATLDDNQKPLSKYYRKTFDSQFSKQVADSLFMRNDYHDTIMKLIMDSKLSPKKEYKYSDLPYFIIFVFEPILMAYPDTSLRHLQFQYQSLLQLNKKWTAYNKEVIIFNSRVL